MFQGKKIILGITGSIAAYKSATLVRLLVKAGAEVKVVMTTGAKQFITPLTLATLSKNPVLSELSDGDAWANHVELGRWADLMLIAPLSCNTLSSMATGRCDNLLMAVYLSATCPVMVAPAMDEDMWEHPSTKENLRKISSFGNRIIPVNEGELASGLFGPGRMAEPEEIISTVQEFFLLQNQLSSKKVLITAGPTYEPIDPVRFIGNHSSGKMGIALAEACRDRGAEVTLVLGPTMLNDPSGIRTIRVQTASDMFDAATALFSNADITLLSAAVADYTPASVSSEKIKKKGDNGLTLQLGQTRDIFRAMGEMKQNWQVLVGFALETNNEVENAGDKLKKKNGDYIVLNSLNDKGAGFGHDTNKITILDKKGNRYEFDTKSKKEVAADIINTITRETYA